MYVHAANNLEHAQQNKVQESGTWTCAMKYWQLTAFSIYTKRHDRSTAAAGRTWRTGLLIALRARLRCAAVSQSGSPRRKCLESRGSQTRRLLFQHGSAQQRGLSARRIRISQSMKVHEAHRFAANNGGTCTSRRSLCAFRENNMLH
jgi:hypothetical protein